MVYKSIDNPPEQGSRHSYVQVVFAFFYGWPKLQLNRTPNKLSPPYLHQISLIELLTNLSNLITAKSDFNSANWSNIIRLTRLRFVRILITSDFE